MDYVFRLGEPKEAKLILSKFHYHGKLAGSNVVVGLWVHRGNLRKIVAACIFGSPAARWKEPVIELNRLVRNPEVAAPLTSLISKTCKEVKNKGWDLCISFADPRNSHHGGIYQAASWNYHEKRKPLVEGFKIDGRKIHKRTCYDYFGTTSIPRLQEMYNQGKIKFHDQFSLFTEVTEPEHVGIEPYMDEGKHLYWRALDKNGKKKAERLGLECNPYPKSFEFAPI